MNVLILHASSDMYGASKILLITSELLKRNGHQVTVILSEDGPLKNALQQAGIQVEIIRLGILRRKYFNVKGLFNRISVIKKALPLLGDIIRQNQIDIVYSNTTGVLIGALLARSHKLRHIWHVHEIITKPAFFTRFIGFLLNRYSDTVIVVSDAVKRHWSRTVDQNKIERVYNGIDTAPFDKTDSALRMELGIGDDTVLIGMIGRVNHWKGQNYFLDIAEKINHQFPAVHFVLVGDAFPGNESLVDDLNERIEHSGFSSKISNLGYRNDIVNILNGLDIFMLPSILPDPFPTVILEAMLAAKLVAATNHGGAPEMLEDQRSGVIIPVNDSSLATEKLIPYIKDQALRVQTGTAARKRVETLFSHRAFEENMLRILSDRAKILTEKKRKTSI